MFTWNPSRQLGAALVADDTLTDVEIAEKAGVAKATLERWKQSPEFKARVADVRKALEKEILKTALEFGIADTRERVHQLDERWKKMQRVILERSKDPVMQEVAGGRTGLLCHTKKAIGSGGVFEIFDEYEVDTGLLRELREHERQAAQELGQWIEKHADATDYDGQCSDWTDEEIKEQLELNRKRRERARSGNPGPVAAGGTEAPAPQQD